MFGNEPVRFLVGTWLVPGRYMVVGRFMLGTFTLTVQVPYWYRTVPYETAYLAELTSFLGI
jgi:hypothetical protein